MAYRGRYDTYEIATDVSVEMTGANFEIEVKRFSVPCTLRWTCPHCGRRGTYKPDYFGYPTANAIDWQIYQCYEEDHRGENIGCGKEIAIPVFIECRARVATAEEVGAAQKGGE